MKKAVGKNNAKAKAVKPSYYHDVDFKRTTDEVEYSTFKPLYRTLIKINGVFIVLILLSLALSMYFHFSIEDTSVIGVDRLGRAYELTLHPSDASQK